MGVYIKGMEMPSGCISCPFKSHGTIDEFKYYCDITGAFVGHWESKKLNQRHKDCPLVEEKIDRWEPITKAEWVRVVRCKDCRWGREACGNIECFVDSNIPSEYHGYEWFCPNGERRSDE